jgi:hypothetical protein
VASSYWANYRGCYLNMAVVNRLDVDFLIANSVTINYYAVWPTAAIEAGRLFYGRKHLPDTILSLLPICFRP